MGFELSEYKDSAAQILKFAGIDDNTASAIISKIKKFASLKEQSSSDDAVRTLRREMNSYFYEIYKAVFFKTLEVERIPDVVWMYLYFGYIDEELAGENNIQPIHDAAVNMPFDEECRIFPFYQWLRLIYNGKKDPSINEFSVDYNTMLRQKKREKEITEAQEKALLVDGKKRVIFEIDNMFKSANRMMSTRVTTFVPFFSSQYLSKPIDKTILDFGSIHKTLNVIRTIDYSLFYRQTVFTAPELGIEKEFIQVEVLPDIILMPTIGGRGAMWQEITGAKRTTPGRFILPIIEEEELTKIIINLCGEFRWELCKRIQGARWNDLTERSLTSDYVDYIDTYKKNRDLSQEAKDRIKSALVKHRNSYKEMFTSDYATYIQYESSGAIRHNKAVRFILFNYCPFSKVIREGAIATNPQFTQLIERYNNKAAHALHLFDISTQRITKAGKDIPAELRGYRMYLIK